MSAPDLDELLEQEEEDLLGKLRRVRSAINHPGEKGTSLESEVCDFVRSFLPGEYGVSNGFILYHGENGIELSPQLDVIIYDAIRSGPIVRLGSCDVFPLEAAYAYIEVKAQLASTSDAAKNYADNSIERCLQNNRNLRKMCERRYWSSAQGSPIQLQLKKVHGLGLRSFVFAFEGSGKITSAADRFAKRMADFSSLLAGETHLHGVYVGGLGYFGTRPVDLQHAQQQDYYHVSYTTAHPLRVFKLTLLNALATFDRYPLDWTPAIGQYHLDNVDWSTVSPT